MNEYSLAKVQLDIFFPHYTKREKCAEKSTKKAPRRMPLFYVVGCR
jgi:hypothetical protein